jgi:hypothetical protein
VFACWRQRGLSIQPNQNLVSNIGVGPDATHFKQGHSTVGIPAHEMGECVHPSAVIRDREADLYTFDEHIDGERDGTRTASNANWLVTTKRRLAIRTRVKRMLPRSWRYR